MTTKTVQPKSLIICCLSDVTPFQTALSLCLFACLFLELFGTPSPNSCPLGSFNHSYNFLNLKSFINVVLSQICMFQLLRGVGERSQQMGTFLITPSASTHLSLLPLRFPVSSQCPRHSRENILPKSLPTATPLTSSLSGCSLCCVTGK